MLILYRSCSKVKVIGQHGYRWEKFTRRKNIFGTVVADSGRGCVIDSFVLSTDLNTDIDDVEFFCAKVVGAISSEGFL